MMMTPKTLKIFTLKTSAVSDRIREKADTTSPEVMLVFDLIYFNSNLKVCLIEV